MADKTEVRRFHPGLSDFMVVTLVCRGCNGIALSHCLCVCKQAKVAMTLHIVIAIEFATVDTSCHTKQADCLKRVKNQNHHLGASTFSIVFFTLLFFLALLFFSSIQRFQPFFLFPPFCCLQLSFFLFYPVFFQTTFLFPSSIPWSSALIFCFLKKTFLWLQAVPSFIPYRSLKLSLPLSTPMSSCSSLPFSPSL